MNVDSSGEAVVCAWDDGTWSVWTASDPTPACAIEAVPDICYCGDASCAHFDTGYPWCRPCGEHHRGPECAIDEQGRALTPQGVPWDEAP